MKKYPRIRFDEPLIENVLGNGFILRGYCKPGRFKKEICIEISGKYPFFEKSCEYLKEINGRVSGHLVVSESFTYHPVKTMSDYIYTGSLIDVLEPDTKKEDVIPIFQKILEEKVNNLAK